MGGEPAAWRGGGGEAGGGGGGALVDGSPPGLLPLPHCRVRHGGSWFRQAAQFFMMKISSVNSEMLCKKGSTQFANSGYRKKNLF